MDCSTSLFNIIATFKQDFKKIAYFFLSEFLNGSEFERDEKILEGSGYSTAHNSSQKIVLSRRALFKIKILKLIYSD